MTYQDDIQDISRYLWRLSIDAAPRTGPSTAPRP